MPEARGTLWAPGPLLVAGHPGGGVLSPEPAAHTPHPGRGCWSPQAPSGERLAPGAGPVTSGQRVCARVLACAPLLQGLLVGGLCRWEHVSEPAGTPSPPSPTGTGTRPFCVKEAFWDGSEEQIPGNRLRPCAPWDEGCGPHECVHVPGCVLWMDLHGGGRPREEIPGDRRVSLERPWPWQVPWALSPAPALSHPGSTGGAGAFLAP